VFGVVLVLVAFVDVVAVLVAFVDVVAVLVAFVGVIAVVVVPVGVVVELVVLGVIRLVVGVLVVGQLLLGVLDEVLDRVELLGVAVLRRRLLALLRRDRRAARPRRGRLAGPVRQRGVRSVQPVVDGTGRDRCREGGAGLLPGSGGRHGRSVGAVDALDTVDPVDAAGPQRRGEAGVAALGRPGRGWEGRLAVLTRTRHRGKSGARPLPAGPGRRKRRTGPLTTRRGRRHGPSSVT